MVSRAADECSKRMKPGVSKDFEQKNSRLTAAIFLIATVTVWRTPAPIQGRV